MKKQLKAVRKTVHAKKGCDRVTEDERIHLADIDFTTIDATMKLRWVVFILQRVGLTCEVTHINGDKLGLFAVRKASQ